MDLSKIPLLQMVTTQMNWLNQRQKTLSQNIANADTPKFIPRDLVPLSFNELAQGQATKLKMTASSPMHLGEPDSLTGNFKDRKDRQYPSEPNGNRVILEEQMMLVSQTQVDYELMTRLYRKHVGMLKTALGRQ